MAKRLLKTMILPLTVVAAAAAFIACDGGDTPSGTPSEAKYKVTYVIGAAGEDVVKNNQPAKNYTVEDPAVYIDYGANGDEYFKIFAGWTVENSTAVYLPASKTTLTGNTVFTAQWVDFDDDNVWFDTTYELQLMLLNEKVGAYILNLGGEEEGNHDLAWTYFTYAVNGTAITVTPAVGNPATGTLEDGELTISVTVGMATYNFVSEQALPEFTFELNGGSGDLPTLTVTEEMYDEQEDCYVVAMPENTITPPDGKQFKEWLVTAESGGERRVAAGGSYYATAGATLTVTPVWEDAGEPAPAGVVLYGNCTLPTSGLMGGETVVQIILDTTDPANVLVYYQLAGENTYTAAQKGTAVQDSWKPTDVYGADALYYGEYILGTRAWNMVVKPDLTALWLCDTSFDEPLDNGEFTTTPPAPATYTVTYNKPDDAEGTMTEVTAQEGSYTLAACTYTKDGWIFLGWKDESLSWRDDPVVTAAGETVTLSEDVSYIAVFAKTYTNANDSTVTVALRDDEYVLWNVNGELVYAVWAPVSETVIIVTYGYSYTAYINLTGNSYTESDEMVAYTFTTEDGNTTLTFDGSGTAMLGSHTGTYEKMIESNPWLGDVVVGVKLTFGGNTYECEFVHDVDANPYINVTINVGGVDYVFNPYTEYTVSFEVGDGATGTAPTQKTVEVIGGGEGEVRLPNDDGMQKTGYGFMGWQIKNGNGNLYYADERCTITGDTTFVAVWGEVKTYTVTYEIGDDVTGTAPAPTTVDTEAGITTAAVYLNNGAGLTKEGYTFEGWKIKNSDNTLGTTVYKTVAAISADTTFVAYFEEVVAGDPTKYSNYVGESSAKPISFGYASIEAAGDNALKYTVSTNVYEIYKIDIYWGKTGGVDCIIANRHYQQTTTSVTDKNTTSALLETASSSGTKIADTDRDVNQSAYIYISSSHNIQVTFGVNEQGTRIVTLVLDGATTFTWTEIAA